jgi:hypothetical protein
MIDFLGTWTCQQHLSRGIPQRPQRQQILEALPQHPLAFSTGAQWPVGTLVGSLRCLLATMLLNLGLYNP